MCVHDSAPPCTLAAMAACLSWWTQLQHSEASGSTRHWLGPASSACDLHRGLTPYPQCCQSRPCVTPTHAGIEFPKLQPAAFDGVRGLAAKADIAADAIIVSVPRQAALTLPPKQRCPCPVSPSHSVSLQPSCTHLASQSLAFGCDWLQRLQKWITWVASSSGCVFVAVTVDVWERGQAIEDRRLQQATAAATPGPAAVPLPGPQAASVGSPCVGSTAYSPAAIAATATTVDTSLCSQEFVSSSYWDAAPWFVKLGVRLLCEQRKGTASPFYQWLQQLPQQVRVPGGSLWVAVVVSEVLLAVLLSVVSATAAAAVVLRAAAVPTC